MGSSAASAAAAAWAVNCLFGGPLTKEELILPGLASEATVSGYHADNIAPALLGGFVLIRWAWSSIKFPALMLQKFCTDCNAKRRSDSRLCIHADLP